MRNQWSGRISKSFGVGRLGTPPVASIIWCAQLPEGQAGFGLKDDQTKAACQKRAAAKAHAEAVRGALRQAVANRGL